MTLTARFFHIFSLFISYPIGSFALAKGWDVGFISIQVTVIQKSGISRAKVVAALSPISHYFLTEQRG